MIFTKITVENYGVYGGINQFDFSVTPDKPIILIGGKNGAGKTTLFESILLCLHGKSNFDKRTTRKLYEKFLENKMHRELHTSTKSKKTSIQVDFKFHHNNKVSDYSVTRSWVEDNGKIIEEFVIKEENKILDTVDEEQWQSFIEELIPKGISKLFFFDGEKIVKMAESGNSEIELKTSFDSLLGIDLVEQLKSDLKIYILRKQGSDFSRIEEEIKQITEAKNSLKLKEDDLEVKLDIENGKFNDILLEISEYEHKLSKLGGGYASKRIMLKEQKTMLQARMNQLKSKISQELHSAIPFTLIPNLLDEIQAQILSEQDNVTQEIKNDVLDEKKSQIKSLLNDSEFLEESKMDPKFSQILNEKIGKLLESDHSFDSEKIFNFSLKDSSDLLTEISQIKKMSNLAEEFDIFNEITDVLYKVDLGIENAPQEEEVSTIIKKLNKLSTDKGISETEIKHKEHELAIIYSRIKIKNNEIREYIDKQFKDQDKTKATELAVKLDVVLKSYVKKLRIAKIQGFEFYLLNYIEELMHKTKFIDKVSISPETFEITLYKKNGDEILKSDLSKGEQQMLATAILWSLAKTSGKPLPFMIDTPLARLDVEHRDNLIDNFYPYASHQLVIFSTDSEIDANYYSKLFKYISKSYALTFVIEEGKSKVHSEYYWNQKGERIIAI